MQHCSQTESESSNATCLSNDTFKRSFFAANYHDEDVSLNQAKSNSVTAQVECKKHTIKMNFYARIFNSKHRAFANVDLLQICVNIFSQPQTSVQISTNATTTLTTATIIILIVIITADKLNFCLFFSLSSTSFNYHHHAHTLNNLPQIKVHRSKKECEKFSSRTTTSLQTSCFTLIQSGRAQSQSKSCG